MRTINLRDYYPAYTSDTFLEVQDEIIETLAQFKRDDHAYYERRRVHKAYYSLDLGDGIENAALYREPSPQEIYEKGLLELQDTAVMPEPTDIKEVTRQAKELDEQDFPVWEVNNGKEGNL